MKPLPFLCCYWISFLLATSPVKAWVFPTRVLPTAITTTTKERHVVFAKTALSVSPTEFGAFGDGETGKSLEVVVDSNQPLLPLRELYPASTARYNGTLSVDSIHTLYYEVHGNNDNNNDGTPQRAALFLHGGPGAGCTANHARFFDPDLYDTIVLFDQRGCGKSTPRGMVHNNTLEHLIQDCESLRQHILGVHGVWHTILGGSWGSTLAIAYAQEYPQCVKSLVLRGVCLLRPAEVDWLFTPQGGAAQQNPEAWQTFANTVMDDDEETSSTDTDDHRSVLHKYYDCFFGTNTTKRWMAARGWMTWEFTVSASYKKDLTSEDSPAVLVSYSDPGGWAYQDRYGRVLEPEEILDDSQLDAAANDMPHKLRQGLPPQQSPSAQQRRHMALTDFEAAQKETMGNFSGLPAMPMLTCYYSTNDRHVMMADLLSTRMDSIRNLPCIAVQGGRDPICPPDTAMDVKQQWPGMELRIPLNAGHSMYHPELVHELVQATDRVGRFVT
ncbi:Proline iminopeptidase [Seminavis robusta]|uniref:prolyl aminopeptidase n=1 Tax=Seminavis robusta TaxID=568900 RepID=A0A9N8HW15_9STRA|nr:Proline iminopeptidase [Seminavis robusta]|eukprot:Sro1583_g283970.1 Proline iminopeptidase (499) ;mRNA; r:16755-18251